MIRLYGGRERLSGTYVPYGGLEGFSCYSLQPIRVQNRDAFTARTDQAFRAKATKFAVRHLSHGAGGAVYTRLRDPPHQIRRGRSGLSHMQEMVRDPLPHGREG